MSDMKIDRRKFLKTSALAGGAVITGNLMARKVRAAQGLTNSVDDSKQAITIPHTKIPVAAEADVVVIGGGPGGFAAALRAARMGAKTIMIEKYDMPGGIHTSGLQGFVQPGAGGIHSELMKKFEDTGCIYTVTEKTLPDLAGNPIAHYDARVKPGSTFDRSSFNPEKAGCVMAAMLNDAGVASLYDTRFVDAVVKSGAGDNTITEVIVENASGRQAIRGKVFVDGSGTAEVAAKAGAPYVPGGGPQPHAENWDGKNRPIPGGLLWIMGGIDFKDVALYQKKENDPMLSKLISAARAAGDIPAELYRPGLKGNCVYANSYIGHPTVDMSPIQGPGTFIFWQNVPYDWGLRMDESAEDEARARLMMREYIDAEADFLVKYVPGFEKAYITNVARYLGIRDGRHPQGEYIFSMEDAIKGRKFPDAVTKPLKSTFYWDCFKPHTYEVPYRCFLPKKVGNLLLTGASLSLTYETIFMVLRGFTWCTQTGEIAGFAAARCVEKGISPKELEWTEPLL